MGTSDIIGLVFGVCVLAAVVVAAGFVAFTSGRNDAIYGSNIPDQKQHPSR